MFGFRKVARSVDSIAWVWPLACTMKSVRNSERGAKTMRLEIEAKGDSIVLYRWSEDSHLVASMYADKATGNGGHISLMHDSKCVGIVTFNPSVW